MSGERSAHTCYFAFYVFLIVCNDLGERAWDSSEEARESGSRIECRQVLSPESEEAHTGELCLAPFGESHLPTHFHTYPRFTCKIWLDSGAPAVTPPQKRRSVGPGGSTPLDFSARGSTNILFHSFRFV